MCLCARMNNWFHFNDIVAVASPLFGVCSVFVHRYLLQLQLQSFYYHFCWRRHTHTLTYIFTLLSRRHSSRCALVFCFYHRSICRLSITTTRPTLAFLVELSNCRLATATHTHTHLPIFFFMWFFASQIVNLLLSVDKVFVSLLLLLQLQFRRHALYAPQRMQHFICFNHL